jgi:hypothetical protein
MQGAENRRDPGDQVEQRSLTTTFINAVDQGAGWTVGVGIVVGGKQAVGKLADKVKPKTKD